MSSIYTAWAESRGIVGRGILVDYAGWADANNIKTDPLGTQIVPVSVIEEVMRSQGLKARQGDILIIRFGWGRAYQQLPAEEAIALAEQQAPPSIGIESSETTLRWIWDNGFAAVASDNPSFEAWPCQNKQFWLHEWFLAGWGLPLGELFDLETLSEECRKRGRWSFFFASMPLKVGYILSFIFVSLFLWVQLTMTLLSSLGLWPVLRTVWLSCKMNTTVLHTNLLIYLRLLYRLLAWDATNLCTETALQSFAMSDCK